MTWLAGLIIGLAVGVAGTVTALAVWLIRDVGKWW